MNPEAPRLSLPPHVTIATVASIDAGLKELPVGAREVFVDATQVERADAAGLQLMLVFVRHARRNQGRVVIEASEAFRTAARILGLGAELGLVGEGHS